MNALERIGESALDWIRIQIQFASDFWLHFRL